MPVLTRKKWIALLLAGFAAFLWVAHSAYQALSVTKAEQQGSALSPLGQGMTMPGDINLEGLGGKASSLADYRGKVVILNFWAGWCGPCLHEMPGLYQLQKSLESRGLVVLGMNMDDDPQDGLRALKRIPGDAPFPMFRGISSVLSERFKIDGLPFTVILDKKFQIVFAQAGEIDWNSARAKALIEGLL